MTQDGSPEHQKPPAGREGPGKQIRRVSQRKELAVVTLGMVAAISGVGGLLAANPPSWATNTQPDHTMVAQKTTANHESIQRAAEQAARRTVEQAAVRPAPQKSAGREEEARKAAVSAQSARRKARRAARR
jgi:type IV secretory pathway VirB10-like protein